MSKFDKDNLKKIIVEEYQKYIQEQGPENDSQKEMFKSNAIKQIRLLKFMREIFKNIKMPEEINNMAAQLKKANTSEYITQVLDVQKSIPINVSAVLENPVGLLQSLIDELINISVKNAKMKLSEQQEKEIQEIEEKIETEENIEEQDLPNLTRDDSRLEKRRKKQLKKQQHSQQKENPKQNKMNENK